MQQEDQLSAAERREARIDQELAAIESSPAFSRSPVMRRLLRFMVTESAAGRGSLIKSYTVAVDGLGRDEDFDAQQDSYPRVQVGRLRKALENYYCLNKPIDRMRFELRPGSYEIHFVETPSRTHTEATEDAASLFQRVCDSALKIPVIWALAVLLVALLIAFATTSLGKRWFAPWRLDSAEATLAVRDLPVVEIEPVGTSAGARRTTAELLSFQLTDALQRSGWLRIRSAQPASASSPPNEVADYQLRSNLYGQGGEITWTLELVESGHDLVIWTRHVTLHPGPAGEIANPQPLLSSIVSAVTHTGGPIAERSLQRNPRRLDPGYACMLRAASFKGNRSVAEYERLSQCLAKTVAAQPRMARALSLQAMLKQDNLDFGFVPAGGDTSAKILALAKAAVDLDPTDGLAAANLAQLQFRHGDYARARVNAEKASALDGYSSELMTRMGTLLFFMNDARGLPMVHRALEADPSPAPWFRMALFYDAVGRGDIQAASAEAARMSEFQGDGRIYVSAINAVAAALRRNGDAARKHWQAVVNRAPNAANDPISIFRRMGASVDYAKRSKAILEAAGAI